MTTRAETTAQAALDIMNEFVTWPPDVEPFPHNDYWLKRLAALCERCAKAEEKRSMPTTKTRLLFTIATLETLRAEDKALIAQLQARLDRVAATCAYCGTIFWNDDPAALEHWRECEKHPARLELEAMRAQLNRRATL